MVIEIQAYFRRLARAATWVLAGALSLCGVAGAQTVPAVTTGSIIPMTHPLYNQIYKFAYWHGYVLALDTAQSVLYQLSPGSTSFTAIYTGASTTPMGASGSYWTEDLAIDNEGNLYLPQRYGTPPMFWRVPFDPVAKTWTLTTNDAWGANIQTSTGASLVSQGSSTLAFLDDGSGTGSGTLFWMTEVSPFVIYAQQVDHTGNPTGSATAIVSGLMNDDGKMSVDANGDIFFVENPGASDSGRVNGAFFVPAGSAGLTGESSITNLIPSSYASTNKFNGATLDAAGNLYLTSESDGYGGTFDGDFMIPNTCGDSQAAVYGPSCYDWNNASYISPVGANNPLTVDPRGFLWIPHYGDYSFPNSGTYGGPDNSTTNYCAGGACNFVIWQMGADNLGPSPVGTASGIGTVFVNFNTAETLGNIGFSQPGTGTDFATTTTNPYPSTSTTTPTQPCATATTTPYQPQTSCPVWLTMTPRTVGTISGQLTLADSNNAAISGSTTYLNGVGQGPMAALLGIPTQTAMAAGLSAPAQVAVDTQGNVYVADPGLGKVLEYAPGSSGATGVSIGKNLTKPTGVAVDGSGDVYIGDSGKIIEIPFVNGALNAAGQVTLFTTNTVPSNVPPNNNLLLGNHLNLAVDGVGDVYAADEDNGQVVEINNPSMAKTENGYAVVGSGFTAPSAVAVDSSGDLYVADGANLYEITPWSSQSLIDSALSTPVTGLAAEPSGSVDVAQSGGILRIPSLAGSFTVNDATAVDTAVTAPNGVAIDNQGNLYVTDMTGGTPNLYEVNTTTNAAFNFGTVGAFIAQEQDVSVTNLGNVPLAFSSTPTFSDTTDFSLVSPVSSACDTTGATPLGTGSSCNLGVQIDPQSTGSISGSMTIASSAVNGTQTANFTANSLLTLEPTATAISVNPTTVTFPGSTTATVTITQAPLGGTAPSTNVPDGPVTVTLTSTVQGSSQPPIVFTGTASGTDTSTTATVPLTGLPGGSYNVKAAYKGNTNYGGSTATTTLVVTPAPPAIAVSEPSAVQPDQFNGVYYVKVQSTSTLTATVTSTLASPTGTVTFMNGSQPADPTQVNQPLDANGQVTFNLKNLPTGSYDLTAVYSGDSNFASITSTPVAFQVLQPSVLLTASPASVSTQAGTPVSSTITLESLVQFSAQGGVNITCDNSTLPQYSECTFNNPQPELCAPPQPGTTAPCPSVTTTVVTISTNIPVNVSRLPAESPFVLAGVLGLGLFGLGLRRRRLISQGLFNVVCLTLLLAGAVAGFTGCTNSGYTHTPPAPHYVTPSGTSNVSIVVTDESSGQQYSLPFTLPLTVK
jgi:hypothetical protein